MLFDIDLYGTSLGNVVKCALVSFVKFQNQVY